MSSRTTDAFDFSDMSHTQANRVVYQLSTIYKDSGYNQIGQSRYQSKQDIMSSSDYNHGGSHEINSKIGITSYSSEDKRINQWQIFAKFCFSECGCKQVKQIKSSMIESFSNQLVERQYSKNTATQYLSSIEKLGLMLQHSCGDVCGGYKDWHSTIDKCREIVKSDCIDKATDSRYYDRPSDIINAMPEEQQFAASLMFSHGLRLSDACNVQHVKDGVLTVQHSKGGQTLQVVLTDKEMSLYKQFCADNGTLISNKNAVSYSFQQACISTGQEWHGCHGARHTFAQSEMARLVNGGMSYNRALYTVSEEMGHHRIEITLTYLR